MERNNEIPNPMYYPTEEELKRTKEREGWKYDTVEEALKAAAKRNIEITKKQRKSLFDIYRRVNDQIIGYLKNGIVPWQHPYAEHGLPKNLITGKPYQGVNVLLLTPLCKTQPYFLSAKQIKSLGASIKTGEKGQEVVSWKWGEEKYQSGYKEIIVIPKYHTVFNISQCSGIPHDKLRKIRERKTDIIKSCEEIIWKMPNRPKVLHNDDTPYYIHTNDYINMPKRHVLKNAEGYYATLFHELVHSSGHAKRLAREEVMKPNMFDKTCYAIEELTAEIGASYLKSYAGVPFLKRDKKSTDEYVQRYLPLLQENDNRLIFYTSDQAQKAVDYILNNKTKKNDPGLLEVQDKNTEMLSKRGVELKNLRGKKISRNIDLTL